MYSRLITMKIKPCKLTIISARITIMNFLFISYLKGVRILVKMFYWIRFCVRMLIDMTSQGRWNQEGMGLGTHSNSHCVRLEHYYSVDFPWWFDREMSFFSLLSKTADNMMIGNKKVVKWQIFKTAFCDLTENWFCWILSACGWDFRSIWKPNPCMDPIEIFFLLYQFLF